MDTHSLHNFGSVLIAGKKGMVGSGFVRALTTGRWKDLCGGVTAIGRDDVDLSMQTKVFSCFADIKPDTVVIAAAKVGGIDANRSQPWDFIYDNLCIQTNILRAALDTGCRQVIFLGSSCIYPRDSKQPICEGELLTKPLEMTNQWYAIAKIAGLKMCQAANLQFDRDFRCFMPTNLFGIGDHYSLSTSHVIPALLLKFHLAKVRECESVTVWGSGNPMREFLYVDDCVDACLLAASVSCERFRELTDGESFLNIGSGFEISIADLAREVASVVGYPGQIVFDSSMPDGSPRKIVNNARLERLGWKPVVSFHSGLRLAYSDFLKRNLV
ncbi:GDP-L-fucose synthase [Litoricola sp.]|nr:GDP-L-fucose synthase [Litorivicinus sp.]